MFLPSASPLSSLATQYRFHSSYLPQPSTILSKPSSSLLLPRLLLTSLAAAVALLLSLYNNLSTTSSQISLQFLYYFLLLLHYLHHLTLYLFSSFTLLPALRHHSTSFFSFFSLSLISLSHPSFVCPSVFSSISLNSTSLLSSFYYNFFIQQPSSFSLSSKSSTFSPFSLLLFSHTYFPSSLPLLLPSHLPPLDTFTANLPTLLSPYKIFFFFLPVRSFSFSPFLNLFPTFPCP